MTEGYTKAFLKQSRDQLNAFNEERKKKNKLRIIAISELMGRQLNREMRNMSILEFGCGTGWGIREFALMHNRCKGVDVFQEVIDIAYKSHQDIPNLDFHKINDELPFEDKTFDFVYSSEVIEHVPLCKRDHYFKEFRRVMKDDGCGYISYPNFWFPLEQHYFIPFHHWLQRVFQWKNLRYEDIPSKYSLRKKLSPYFNYKNVTLDFLRSSYVQNYYPKYKTRIARVLSRSPFSIQDYLFLTPK